MSTISELAVEYSANTRLGEKGQITVPKGYRQSLGLEPGDPIAVVRVGNAMILIPEDRRFRRLCDSIASAFTSRGITVGDVLQGLPSARQRVFDQHYGSLAKKRVSAKAKRRK
jgi:AbrB family looped-hinge helix DNA binding protein